MNRKLTGSYQPEHLQEAGFMLQLDTRTSQLPDGRWRAMAAETGTSAEGENETLALNNLTERLREWAARTGRGLDQEQYSKKLKQLGIRHEILRREG